MIYVNPEELGDTQGLGLAREAHLSLNETILHPRRAPNKSHLQASLLNYHRLLFVTGTAHGSTDFLWSEIPRFLTARYKAIHSAR